VGKKINLSDVSTSHFPEAAALKIGVVTSLWNPEVTGAMRDAAIDYLVENGVAPGNIVSVDVPGSFELPLAAQYMLDEEAIDGVVCIGCIIQGETRHFDFIADAVAHGIMQVNLDYNAPVSFGVLTTDNQEQAIERAGGRHGNKGIEAAAAVLSMLKLKLKVSSGLL
jgi:6,7-dimethyl-8-ribityllumazine synthase